jgi:hypothetical protein
MDLSAIALRDTLSRIDVEGWDGVTGRQLLDDVRRAVVIPVVRGSGIRGAAADQAEASGWAAAWDALRRPTSRTALNPGGMVWAAVRRAVAAECAFTRNAESGSAVATRTRVLSLDHLMDDGWHGTAADVSTMPDSGPVVTAVLNHLIEAGWTRQDAADAIGILAEEAGRTRGGSPTTRWRWVSLRLGVPQWQARRLAAVLIGGDGWPGVLELSVRHGPGVLDDPTVQGALRSTTHRWAAGPRAWLASWGSPVEGIA